MTYRPEIDGLRAVAVVPVILFHAGVGALAGGFVGVDVFFVISGYLITSIILRERAEGRFSMLRFWERRARRILPALYVVAHSDTSDQVFRRHMISHSGVSDHPEMTPSGAVW